MRWQVRINDTVGETLADVLAAVGYKLDGDRLSGDAFESLDDWREVRDLAHHVAHTIREIARMRDDIDLGFHAGPVIEFGENGEQIHQHVVAPISASISIKTNVVAVLTDGSLSPEERAEKERREHTERASEVLSAALSDDVVLTVMRLLDGEPGTFELWKAFELIQKHGGIMRHTSKNQIRRFRHAVNNPAVSGDAARHAVPQGAPPSDPMSVDDATAYLREIAENWIKKKAGDGLQSDPAPGS